MEWDFLVVCSVDSRRYVIWLRQYLGGVWCLIVDPGDEPGGLVDGGVAVHPGVGVGGGHVAAGARDHDQLVRGRQGEHTLGVCVPLLEWGVLRKGGNDISR